MKTHFICEMDVRESNEFHLDHAARAQGEIDSQREKQEPVLLFYFLIHPKRDTLAAKPLSG